MMNKEKQPRYLQWWETFAISLFPKKGECPNSPFADGEHRAGIIPVMSLLDGGAAGDVAKEICLHCGEVFKESEYFYIINQPNKIGGSKEAS